MPRQSLSRPSAHTEELTTEIVGAQRERRNGAGHGEPSRSTVWWSSECPRAVGQPRTRSVHAGPLPRIKPSGLATDRYAATALNSRVPARERAEATRERVEIRRELRGAGLL